MAKQTFTSGQVLTAAEMNSLQENDYNWTVSTKTASYTLAAGDEGTRIVMNNAGATTITVDDAVFAAGDVVWLHNIGAGTCTITAGTATVSTLGELALEQYAGGHLYFTSASAAIFFPTEQGGGGKILQVVRDTDTTDRSTTSTSFVDLTGVTVTITPTSATSDIMVVFSGEAVCDSASSNNMEIQITDSSNVALSGAEGSFFGNFSTSVYAYTNAVMIGYASPASTSAQTYKVRFRSGSGGAMRIRGSNNTTQLFAIEVGA